MVSRFQLFYRKQLQHEADQTGVKLTSHGVGSVKSFLFLGARNPRGSAESQENGVGPREQTENCARCGAARGE